MPAHPYFADLRVPSNGELAAAMGSAVVSRHELQAWPLALTEDLLLEDGRRCVCKTQLPPTVEAPFYAAARSPLLANCLDLGGFGRCRVVVIDWIDGAPLDATDVDRFLGQASRVVDGIAAIDGDPPVHLDLSTAAALRGAAQATTERLYRLIGTGRFHRLTPGDVPAFEGWARSDRTVAAAVKYPGIVHADLSRDEVLLTGDGQLRVIDWQRPVRGPREIDLVSLLRSGGIDPEGHVDRCFVQLEAFVLLHWAALCAAEILSELPTDTYEAWVLEAIDTLRTPTED